MPPRRKANRRYSTSRAVMERRLGIRGWARSRPFFEWSKTLVTRTLGEGHNPGTTTGALFRLPVNNWNDPLGTLSTLVAGTGSLTANRHPVHHDTTLSVGFNRVQVLSWNAKISVNWIGAESSTQDFVVGYQFVGSNATEVNLTAGTAARIERMEFETNPRWTLKHFNAAGGVDSLSTKNVYINVPNVFAYADILAKGVSDTEANNNTVGHGIGDVDYLTSPLPTIRVYVNVVIYTESGLAMPIDSVHVTVAITQRVKIMRDFIGGEDMDDGEVDVHA